MNLSSEEKELYEKSLTSLRARRASLNKMITGLEELLGVSPEKPEGDAEGAAAQPVIPQEVASDTFFGIASVADAAKKYLSMVKKPKSVSEIQEALEKGGFNHTSKKFYTTVYTALDRRANGEQDIIRVKRDWGLAEWYPGYRKKLKGSTEKNGEPVAVPETEKKG